MFAFGRRDGRSRQPAEALGAALFCCTLLPLLVLKFKRGRRQKKFGAQFPDALDIIVRSLRAGHPVPIAITMVAREMADPVGTEFGIVADEITYGADLETGDAQPVSSASARTTCRCSSPRWRSRARPAATSAKSWKTCRRSSASASRCAARSARSPPKAAPRR